MAMINGFYENPMEQNSIHDGLDASFTIFERDGASFLQIDTYGSDLRANPGKKSQSIQLSRESGLAMIELIKRTFNLV